MKYDLKYRYFVCSRCKQVTYTSGEMPYDEDRCEADRANAPGGYWYCKYEEFIFRKKRINGKDAD